MAKGTKDTPDGVDADTIKKDITEKEVVVEEVVNTVAEDTSEKTSVVADVEDKQSKQQPHSFRIGDTVRVFYKVVEGKKTRVQPFEGIVIARKGAGVSQTFTVRKIASQKIGVERIFPMFSPNVEKVEVVKKPKRRVRKAKLYYLRDRIGKAAVTV